MPQIPQPSCVVEINTETQFIMTCFEQALLEGQLIKKINIGDKEYFEACAGVSSAISQVMGTEHHSTETKYWFRTANTDHLNLSRMEFDIQDNELHTAYEHYESDWVEAITKLPSRSFLSNLVGKTIGHEETDVANKKINHPAVVAHTFSPERTI